MFVVFLLKDDVLLGDKSQDNALKKPVLLNI